MPKDLQALISKATRAAGEPKKVDGNVVPKNKAMVKEAAAPFKESSKGPDELVQKHAEETRRAELLEDRDRRVNEGMHLLLSAADSILSASRCRET